MDGSKPELVTLGDLTLAPVVELAPYDFAAPERVSPGAQGTDEGWRAHWFASLADAGITGLMPLYPGSWLVTTRHLSESPALDAVLRGLLMLGDDSDEAQMRRNGALEGGFALFADGELVIKPSCCNGLYELCEWQEAAAHREPVWKDVWIGHPWISVRFREGRLILSDYHEGAPFLERWAVDPADLGRAVAAAQNDLEVFAGALRRSLRGLQGRAGARILARRLAGLEEPVD